MTTTRNPTIHDVARHAGVSHMTVSRVINGDHAVRSRTRASVEASIKMLRFTPNLAARALSSAKHAHVALLHCFPNPGSLGDFFIQLLQAATQAHATLIIREVANSNVDRSVVEDLVERRVQGVILAPPLADDPVLVSLLREAGMAVVATGSTHGKLGVASVGIDDRTAAKNMTAHLLGLGHCRIGFVQGRTSHASSGLRLAGYLDAISEAGIEPDADLIAKGTYDYQSGMAAADKLLSLPEAPTAIFASNDDMAAAAVSVAHRRGIDVPSGLSICGFDDASLAASIWPTLTTVRRPTAELTATLFRVLLGGIAGKDANAPAERIVLQHSIVCRESDGPPPKAQSNQMPWLVSGAG
jgi:LacI family transcriptional regulator